MKEDKIIYIIILVLVFILMFTLGMSSINEKKSTDLNDLTQPDPITTSLDFVPPPADEFEESPLYSMYWVSESAWINQGILLVKADRMHKNYGYAPCFVKALIEVKKKYTITARIPICTRWESYTFPTDALLLEVEPKKAEQKQ